MGQMRIQVVVAPVFGTNCCVVIADPAGEGGTVGGSSEREPRDCVVVDAGAGVADAVTHLVETENLVPRAVLATHGHADHTWDASELCARYDVPMRLHAADAYRLDDPFGTLGIAPGAPGVSGALTQALADLGLHAEDYRAPAVVEPFDGASGTVVAGDVVLRTLHAPGHTEGSTLYLLDDASIAGPGQSGLVLAGDVLFAGSVGRTDLPGGDAATMRATLRDVVATLDPGLAVVPGHGPATTVGQELATNPFLR